MLFRLVLFAVLIGLGALAWRSWRARAALAGRTLSDEELGRFQALAARSEALSEALELRDKIRQVGAGEAASSAREGVEEAVRELALKVELMERLERTARDLEADASDEALAEAKREAAGDGEGRELAEERVKVLERQRASAAELTRRQGELARANERIVLGLKDVHVALLELSASTGSDGAGGTVRGKLEEASEELRRRASAHDEVKAFLEAAKQG